MRRATAPLTLLAMAVVKLALLAVAFKSGFLGGPTFPAIFASVCVALAHQPAPAGRQRSDVMIGGVMAGFLVVLFKAPFMVILLTVVMLQAQPGADRADRPRRGRGDDRPALRPGGDRGRQAARGATPGAAA